MKKKKYTPQPIDTTDVVIPEQLKELVEVLAKDVHESWAAQRIADGWTYGTQRDDKKKKHPCLVPYEELPEEEKTYDRLTSFHTLKVITYLGYRIQAPEEISYSST